MKCPRCQQENRPDAKYCDECGTPATGADLAQPHADLKDENEGLRRSLTEALEQQTAAAEILRVISSTPTDLQPVFAAMAARAARLCDAFDATIFQVDGDVLRLVAHEGPITPDPVLPLTPGTIGGRVVRERRAIHVADMQAEMETYPLSSGFARDRGFRAILSMPLLHGAQAIGLIAIRRAEVRPFTDRQVELVRIFADQAVIAIENARLLTELQARTQELARSVGELRALGEVGRAVSSTLDLPTVLATIVSRAVGLSGAAGGAIYEYDEAGEEFHLRATESLPEQYLQIARQAPGRKGEGATGQLAITHAPIEIPDIAAPGAYQSRTREALIRTGHRSLLAVPLLREDRILGSLVVFRKKTGSFGAEVIELLRTFATQSALAIQNARLYAETKRREWEATRLYEIGSQLASNLDATQVLDLITAETIGLLGCDAAGLYMYDAARGGLTFHRGIHLDPELTRDLVLTPGEGVAGRAFEQRRPFWTRDRLADPVLRYTSGAAELVHAKAPRAYMAVPILSPGEVHGVLVSYFFEPHDFTPNEVRLLSSLADHAAIALEKIRQFQQIRAHAVELVHRVEQLGALNEIGQVVSSTLDLDRLLRTIVARAAQLAGADAAVVTEYDEPSEEFRPRASHGFEAEIVDFFYRTPLRKGQGAIGRLADTHEPVQIPDIAPPDAYQSGLRALLTQFGHRALLAIPLICDDRLVGGLVISRKTPGAFAADIVDLMTTFATQSALAIQNARLYGETTKREQEATRLYEITSQLASNLDVDRVLDLITGKTIDLLGCDAAGLYMYDAARGGLTFHRGIHLDPELTRDLVLIPGEGIAGRAFQERRPVWTADRLADPTLQYTSTAEILIQTKAPRAYMAVPILSRGEVFGVLVDYFFEPHGFAPKEIQLLSTLADHAAIVIENIRLLEEVRAKSRELELASQHKSQFLANMSHELRTPMNAIIGVSELLLEDARELGRDEEIEPLERILRAARHLLALINDILDLSKIEAGRMELELADFSLPATLDNALALVRERAARLGIVLQTRVDDRIDQIRGDERKIRQVLLNLLSNAIKFTPEGGRIDVGAVPKDGFVEVSVSDTGVGIAPEDQETVFEEFRQVGAADKKVEGTGLGLALARKFIELHGGRVWVSSELGKGSTFTFSIPVRRGD